ncbi:MAG: rhodanese-like domain-containing protein [Candidatus Levybacteria bacterium]|nr:rhodanese-like domain-containing protein [Candidatus Levybacteria bacterium]
MFGIGVKVPEISVDELKKLIDNGQKITILDVRTELEVSRGKILNSINIPLDRIQKTEELVPDKNSEIYVYCLSGSRSAIAVDQLIKMGYQNTHNVASGLLAWRAKKFPLTDE